MSLRILKSPSIVATFAACAYLVFAIGLWNARGRDLSRFIVLGAQTVDETQLPAGVTVLPDSVGYDGTAFYRLALDPFTRTQTAFGIPLDMPAYRHQRIAYPLLTWALSLGQPSFVPLMLVVVNLLAIFLLGFFGASLSMHFGRNAWFGAIAAFYPGFLYSISRDLCEPLACAFALAALLATAKRRPLIAATMLTCAVLTRETFLILVIAYAIQYAFERKHASTFAIPLCIWIVWQIVLTMNWGVSPMRAGAQHIAWTFPFADYWRVLVESSSLRRIHRLHFCEALLLGVGVISAAIALWRSRAERAWKFAWIGNVMLASMMISNVWREDVSYMRVLSDLQILGAALVLATDNAIARWLITPCTIVVWYYLATHLVKYS